MSIEEALAGQLLHDEVRWGLSEFAVYCRIERGELVEMIEMGVLEPLGADPEKWSFAARDLQRVRTARRLARDLQINLAGIAVILDLLEEREQMLARLRVAAQSF